jgi:hypothetical protein
MKICKKSIIFDPFAGQREKSLEVPQKEKRFE